MKIPPGNRGSLYPPFLSCERVKRNHRIAFNGLIMYHICILYELSEGGFMHVKFPEVDEKFIKSQVVDGFYTNETELVRDAVRRMREEGQKEKRLYEAVMLGDQAIERGATVPYSRELMDDIRKRAIQKAKSGEKVTNADVVPEKDQT